MKLGRRQLLGTSAAALFARPSDAGAARSAVESSEHPQRPAPNVTAALAQHVAQGSLARLPQAARTAAARSLLDMTGVMLAATGLEPQATLFGMQAAEDGGRPDATLLGIGLRVPVVAAAFANGALAHAMDFGDGHSETLVHPHGAVVPAALAVAERTGASGAELVAAIAYGADVAVRCARGLGPDPDGGSFYRPALIGAFGAAAASGMLLRLNAAQIAGSWSILLCELGTGAAIKRGTLRGVRDAFAARSGVSAALLASHGLGSDIPDAIEGQGGLLAMFGRPATPEAMLDALGTRFEGAGVAYKPWPACGGTHPHIAAVLELLDEGIDPAAIERIEARVAPLFYKMTCVPVAEKMAPADAITAKFSMYWCLGIAVLRRSITLRDFEPAALRDPQVAQVVRRVTCIEDRSLNPLEGVVTITLRDGSRHERAVRDMPGGPERPLNDDALINKFVDCIDHAARPVPEAAARSIARQILAIDHERQAANFIKIIEENMRGTQK